MANWVRTFLANNPGVAARQIVKRARHSLHTRREDGKIEGVASELADVLIRLGDASVWLESAEPTNLAESDPFDIPPDSDPLASFGDEIAALHAGTGPEPRISSVAVFAVKSIAVMWPVLPNVPTMKTSPTASSLGKASRNVSE